MKGADATKGDTAKPILDADLAARLDGMHGNMRDVLLRHLIATQEERDAVKALSPVKRRRIETRELVAGQRAEEADRHHIHSVIALCGLPYRDPGTGVREHLREYGKSSLAIQAGYLKDPLTGRMAPQGLPYGPKARLLLLHICTMAVRQKSAEIEIADSMSAFIRDLGFPVTVALEALELRLAEAGACVNQALSDAVRGHLNGAVGAVMPLAVSLPETVTLIDSLLVLHRHGRRDEDAPPGLFPE